MKRTRLAAAIGTAALAAAGLGASTAITACGSARQAPAAAATSSGSAYAYYQSVMGRLYSASGSSGMMGGTSSRGWMMGGAGYQWMMGGLNAPAWMSGSTLPAYMMGSSRDPGKIMGALYASAPGARVSASEAALAGSQVPAGATVSRAQHRVTFSGTSVRITVMASPAGGPDETFRIAGMVNPAIVVKAHAHVTMQLVNADPGTAHGLVIAAGGAKSSWMPMLTAPLAFPGSAVWFLGNPTSAGMHAATLSFAVGTPGTYRYLCPVPGHAQKGMTGTFTVSA
jgi:rusticyanin